MSRDEFQNVPNAYVHAENESTTAFRARWEGPEGVRELAAAGRRLAEKGPGTPNASMEFADRLELKLEVYRRVLRNRSEGYRTPGSMPFEALLEMPVRDLRNDAEYGFIAEERGLETLLIVEGDLSLEGDLDLGRLYGHADVFVVRGDLTVCGAVLNREDDYGPVVYVGGRTVADALAVGGATIELKDAYLHLGVIRSYNHGSFWSREGDAFVKVDLEEGELRYEGTALYDFTSMAAALFHPVEGLFDLEWVDLDAEQRVDSVRLGDPDWIAARLAEAEAWVEARFDTGAFIDLWATPEGRLCWLEAFAAVWPQAAACAS